MHSVTADGPFFDDLAVGAMLDGTPAITIDAGVAALYSSITGDGLALACSSPLSERVTGSSQRLVNPALVMQVSIGQSTVATRRVVANLFYRNVRFSEPVYVDDTLATTVTVMAMRENRQRSGRLPTGLALLRVVTTNQHGAVILDYERCAMLLRRRDTPTGHRDDVGAAESGCDLADFDPRIPTWRFAAFPNATVGFDIIGLKQVDPTVEPVRDALALVRLTHNRALAHRDPAHGQGGRPLLYGGHAVGLAQASLLRLAPGVLTVLGWVSCDHTGPVFEGDLLATTITLLDTRIVAEHPELRVARYTVHVDAQTDDDGTTRPVLEWQTIVLERTSPQ